MKNVSPHKLSLLNGIQKPCEVELLVRLLPRMCEGTFRLIYEMPLWGKFNLKCHGKEEIRNRGRDSRQREQSVRERSRKLKANRTWSTRGELGVKERDPVYENNERNRKALLSWFALEWELTWCINALSESKEKAMSQVWGCGEGGISR